ncbi:MAG TPA: metalloregulator ArsR/SmtB family transcription factor [Thermomicrobiales bacterium]|nr:metalloregulator ArsR/SmtB family transcription factor [Thermomicrobiales bacterium]
METAHRDFKGLLYDQFARVTKAVANPHRLELIDLLAQGERRVDELAREAGLTMANASQHLQTLRQGGLVESRRDGTAIYYRLADEGVFRLWQAIREVGEARLAEIDRLTRTYLHDRTQLEAIDVTTLERRLAEDDVVVLDVRPDLEYRAAHIAGARSIPVTELASRLDEIPRDREIVAYCRGPYCVFSDEAVALLREHGYQARRLDIGLPDWHAAGMPTESSDSPSEGRIS